MIFIILFSFYGDVEDFSVYGYVIGCYRSIWIDFFLYCSREKYGNGDCIVRSRSISKY